MVIATKLSLILGFTWWKERTNGHTHTHSQLILKFLKIIRYVWARMVAQWLRVLANKPDDLEIHMVERGNTKLSSDLHTHNVWHVCMHTHKHTHSKE